MAAPEAAPPMWNVPAWSAGYARFADGLGGDPPAASPRLIRTARDPGRGRESRVAALGRAAVSREVSAGCRQLIVIRRAPGSTFTIRRSSFQQGASGRQHRNACLCWVQLLTSAVGRRGRARGVRSLHRLRRWRVEVADWKCRRSCSVDGNRSCVASTGTTGCSGNRDSPSSAPAVEAGPLRAPWVEMRELLPAQRSGRFAEVLRGNGRLDDRARLAWPSRPRIPAS